MPDEKLPCFNHSVILRIYSEWQHMHILYRTECKFDIMQKPETGLLPVCSNISNAAPGRQRISSNRLNDQKNAV